MSNRVGTKSIRLRYDQLDLIVIIAERVYDLSAPNTTAQNDTAAIVGRRVLRKRCTELIQAVIAVYPEAGK